MGSGGPSHLTPMDRKAACLRVAEIITAERNSTHGEPVAQLAHITAVQRALGHREAPHLNDTCKAAIDAIVMKLSRLVKGQAFEDHFLDILGYAAIAVESLDVNQESKSK